MNQNQKISTNNILIPQKVSAVKRHLFDIDQGIHKGKSKVAQSEKRKKLCGFSYT